MDSYTKTPPPIFTYNPASSDHHQESDKSFSGVLEIHVHHARNIHNICIYDKQDVYAKFSLTCDPDEAISTRIVLGGGKNPEFNENLTIKIDQVDAVLKCEIWMLSRAKNYLDDQLLGFVLVSIASILGKGKVTQDFSLSSTDLFHSPAGAIKLSLSLNPEAPLNLVSFAAAEGDDTIDDLSATSEFLSDEKMTSTEEYSRIEFPDLTVASESQQMVSELFAKNANFLRTWLEGPVGSFLHLGSAPNEDCEMLGSSSDESPHGSVQNSGFLGSTVTSLSDDRNSGTDSKEKKNEAADENRDEVKEGTMKQLEADESAMQQQIVDMYMRSMQQFTESLAKMKLPMDLGKKARGDDDDHGILIQNHGNKSEINDNKESEKDNSRVFYGSRAFF